MGWVNGFIVNRFHFTKSELMNMSEAPQSRSPFVKCTSPMSIVCIDTGSSNEFILGLAAITKRFGSCLSHFGSGGKRGGLSFGDSTWVVDSKTSDSVFSTVSTAKRLFVAVSVPIIASRKVQTSVVGWIGLGSSDPSSGREILGGWGSIHVLVNALLVM